MKKDTKIKVVSALAAGSILLTLAGCSEELAPDVSDLDVLNTNYEDDASTNTLNEGVEQIKEVPDENFKLVINYQSGSKEWKINANKSLYVTIKTKGLPSDKEVYIDNIHMDTSIVSTKAQFDGIEQDSMDDRIHNSLMLGFPISDTNSYFGVNEIEGQNQTFLQGYSYGYRGYQHGEVETKRYLEKDFLEHGVWANKVDSVIDLIIVDKTTGEKRVVSVDTKLLIEVNNKVTYLDGNNYVTYQYDRDGEAKQIKKEQKK